MPYSESLAERVRSLLASRRGIVEKKMFGGVCFLLHGNLCAGIWKDALIARLGLEAATEALQQPHVRDFDITGKAMKKWVLVEPEGIETDEQLSDWLTRSLAFARTLPTK